MTLVWFWIKASLLACCQLTGNRLSVNRYNPDAIETLKNCPTYGRWRGWEVTFTPMVIKSLFKTIGSCVDVVDLFRAIENNLLWFSVCREGISISQNPVYQVFGTWIEAFLFCANCMGVWESLFSVFYLWLVLSQPPLKSVCYCEGASILSLNQQDCRLPQLFLGEMPFSSHQLQNMSPFATFRFTTPKFWVHLESRDTLHLYVWPRNTHPKENHPHWETVQVWFPSNHRVMAALLQWSGFAKDGPGRHESQEILL